ncbi:SAM-dependent methyltransferase, partial [Vibrio lentus]|nr:SAM-dependent methyltransferase [Vibrio lentus]
IEVDKDTVVENQGIDDRLAHSRWRCFGRKWICDIKGDSLDISWLKDKGSIDSARLSEPDVLAREAKEELKAALNKLDELLVALEEAS